MTPKDRWLRRAGVGLIAAAVLLQTNADAQTVRAKLLGSWRLVKYDVIAADGSTRPGNFDTGVVSYDASGHMSAHLWRAAGRNTAPPRTDADRSAAYQSYLGYYGPFDVNEAAGTVVHHVRGSSYPDWVGSDQLRYYELDPDGRHLMLSVKNGDRVASRLTWERQ
jgi:hypothetical protein